MILTGKMVFWGGTSAVLLFLLFCWALFGDKPTPKGGPRFPPDEDLMDM
jgi:hypothetical protein